MKKIKLTPIKFKPICFLVILHIMKTKKEIVTDWITRYTGVELEAFGDFILLTLSLIHI